MKPFLTALAVATPTVAALLYFSLQGREEVKNAQEEMKIDQKVEAAKFDQDFAAAWNKNGAVHAPTRDEVAALETERQEVKAKKNKADIEQQQDLSDLKSALNSSGAGK